MRLSKEMIDFFKDIVSNISQEAKVYLFGSRVDDKKKGGDIDLLVISQNITKKHLRKIRVEFYKRFGEQKLDIVLDDGSLKDPFVKIIKNEAILL